MNDARWRRAQVDLSPSRNAHRWLAWTGFTLMRCLCETWTGLPQAPSGRQNDCPSRNVVLSVTPMTGMSMARDTRVVTAAGLSMAHGILHVMSPSKSLPRNDWQSPTACEISDAVWTIHRSYELVCGLASDDARRELRRRQLQCPEDRRREPRRKLCMPVDLIPVRIVDDQLIVTGDRVAAVTHDLSGQGLGLRHDRPLSTRFFAAEFDVFGDPVLMLIDARWTRREDELAFLSGGRFVMVVDPSRLIPAQSIGRPIESDASMNTVTDVS